MARGGAGNSQCRPSIFDNRWAGPTVLVVDLGVCWGGCLSLINCLSLFSPSLLARYRSQYCLKELLNPKHQISQRVNDPSEKPENFV